MELLANLQWMVEKVVEREEAGARQDAEGEERRHPDAASFHSKMLLSVSRHLNRWCLEIEPKVVWFSATSYHAALL